MRAARLQNALERLTAAIRDVESELAAMKSEHDPLASHIFILTPSLSERQRYEEREASRDYGAIEFQSACDLGFRGSLDEWNRLMGAVARR